MTYRMLGWFPVAFAALLAVAALAAGDGGLASVLTIQNEGGKLLALSGFVAAALAFERGDYLRRAWLFAAGCDAMLLTSDAIAGAVVAHRLSLATHEVRIAQAVLVTLGNASISASTWMLARAWSVAGLEEDGEARSRRRLLFVGGAVVALVITGWGLARDTCSLARGELEAVVNISSDLGDTASLALLAPVVHTVLALRGGVLRWPWGFLAGSIVAWLAYDLVGTVIDAMHLTSAPWVIGSEALRALACAYGFSAGLAQRHAVSDDTEHAPGATAW